MGYPRIGVATPWDDCPYGKSNANTFVRACAYMVFPDLVCRKTLYALSSLIYTKPSLSLLLTAVDIKDKEAAADAAASLIKSVFPLFLDATWIRRQIGVRSPISCLTNNELGSSSVAQIVPLNSCLSPCCLPN